MSFLEPVTLTGELVVLEPLRREHHDEAVAAVSDGALWELRYTSVPRPEEMAQEIERRLRMQAARTMLPMVLRRAEDGRLVGMTTFCNADAANVRVEVGHTWTAASAQRTGVNAEAKLLLLRHAFEQWGCIAVELRTHVRNEQSRTAIARLGATQDGILRSHSRSADGSLRDTVVLSITGAEWPAVRAGLEQRLTAHRRG